MWPHSPHAGVLPCAGQRTFARDGDALVPMRRRAVAAATTAPSLLGMTTAQAAPSGDTVRPGDSLAPGEWVVLADRSHGLTHQGTASTG